MWLLGALINLNALYRNFTVSQSSYFMSYSFYCFFRVRARDLKHFIQVYTFLKQERFHVVIVEKPYHEEILELTNRWHSFETLLICHLLEETWWSICSLSNGAVKWVWLCPSYSYIAKCLTCTGGHWGFVWQMRAFPVVIVVMASLCSFTVLFFSISMKSH